MSIVHLHNHSDYSLLDGLQTVDEMVARAVELKCPALGLTDHGTMAGVLKFYMACKDAGIKPIIGIEVYIFPPGREHKERKSYHLTLLARNNTGYHNLLALTSKAYTTGFYYKPRIDWELLVQHKDGLICLSGCVKSPFSSLIMEDELISAQMLAIDYRGLFTRHFYIELMNNGLAMQKKHMAAAYEIARALNIRTVATSDAHYACQSDAEAHDNLLCVNTRKRLDDPDRMKMDTDQFCLRSREEMVPLFNTLDLDCTLDIADQCNVTINTKRKHFPVADTLNPKTELFDAVWEAERDLVTLPGKVSVLTPQLRIQQELDVIIEKDFASYFIIVADIVRWARSQGISCQARGSAGGSLVAFLLGITRINPLDYGLLFERFLDPSRSDPPDIDIDFEDDRRDEVSQYIRDKYGEDKVAYIGTYGTFAPKAALRDVGRAWGVDYGSLQHYTKQMSGRPNATLAQEARESNALRVFRDANPRIFKMAQKLEGRIRQAGTHAAGLVIADKPLQEIVPLQTVKRGDTRVTATQWDMRDCEKIGLLKVDLLGLKTLSVIRDTVQMLNDRRGGTFDIHSIPLDDAETFKMIRSGHTAGVFQLEPVVAARICREIGVNSIEDIAVATSLDRPGPLATGMDKQYAYNKKRASHNG